jgi:uncharacterized protein
MGEAMNGPPFAHDGSAGKLLIGHVTHERVRPVHHAFRYPLLQVCCDIGRFDALGNRWFGIDRWRALALASRDYGPCDGSSLETWMRARLADAGIPADGAIWLQTIPRVFGHAFNPVSFWYAYDSAGRLRALYADVRNTFGGRHGYLLSARGHAPIDRETELICRKTFHVSPFCRVEGGYVFRVVQRRACLSVAIDYHDRQGLLLRTAISMRAEPLSAARMLRVLAGRPFDALGVLSRIHWQALRLWLKRVPFHGSAPPPTVPLDAVHPDATPARRPSESDHEVRP